MRKVIIILLLYIPIATNAADYYVATNGNDNNPGTLSKPWATWQKGFNSISAGDILFIRGGTYSPTSTKGSGSGGTIYAGVYISGKDGTSGSKYHVFNYPGEIPVLDGKNITNTGRRAGILLNGCNYWHIKGLVTRNVAQYSSGAYSSQGMQINSGNNNLIENCVSHGNGGPGFRIRTPDGHDNTFLNCDSYNNYDPYTATDGDDADGFDIGYLSSNYRVRFTGCRSWDNGDDGFDMYQGSGYSGIVYLTNCWAWRNGYVPGTSTTAGNGCGYKYGDDNQTYTGTTKRYSYNCIAYDNRTRGFSQESANVKKEFYNCIAYSNNTHGFSFWGLDVADVLRNNISWGNTSSDIEQVGTARISDHNSWDGEVVANSSDFVSTDWTQLLRPRKADGSLPDITAFHLVAGSDLIDKGANVGLSFSGIAPDLGAFEQQASPTAEASAPAITMTIAPNPVHRFINILFAYTTTFSKQDPSASPQIIRILDASGKLFIEKLLVTGISNVKFPINLRSGIYTVMVMSGGINISSQKLLVCR